MQGVKTVVGVNCPDKGPNMLYVLNFLRMGVLESKLACQRSRGCSKPQNLNSENRRPFPIPYKELIVHIGAPNFIIDNLKCNEHLLSTNGLYACTTVGIDHTHPKRSLQEKLNGS